MRGTSVALAALLFVPLGAVTSLPASAGETKILIRADGVKMIMNEPGEARTRRLADRLMPIPYSEMAEAIEDAAGRLDLDPKLVRAVVQVESGYNVDALSNKGAMGLMQLMPGTARDLGVANPWDLRENIAGGAAYLRRMIDQFQSIELAVAAYNAGPAAVTRHDGIPPYAETREYVRRVLRLFDGTEYEGGEAVGRKVAILRDANNQIRLTTASVGRQ